MVKCQNFLLLLLVQQKNNYGTTTTTTTIITTYRLKDRQYKPSWANKKSFKLLKKKKKIENLFQNNNLHFFLPPRHKAFSCLLVGEIALKSCSHYVDNMHTKLCILNENQFLLQHLLLGRLQ